MSKRELQIPTDKILPNNVQEDILLRSPSTTPDKGLRDLLFTKKINGSNCSHYDIAPTESQAIKRGDIPSLLHFSNEEQEIPLSEEVFENFGLDLKLGIINE